MFVQISRSLVSGLFLACSLIGLAGCSSKNGDQGTTGESVPAVANATEDSSTDTIVLPAEESQPETEPQPQPAAEPLPASTLVELIEAFDAEDYRFGVAAEQAASRWQATYQRFATNAAAEDAIAQAALYYCYSKGLGTEKDEAKAFASARSATAPRSPQNVTHAAGKHVLGEAYLNGVGVPQDEAAAFELIEAAAARGFALSQFELGRRSVKRILGGERLTSAEQAEAIELLTEAHEAGILKAKTLLGQLHLKGALVPRPNLKLGTQLIEAAAAAGHPHAQNVAFTIYQMGAGPVIPKDLQRAREFLEQAAVAGHAESQFQLAAAFLQEGKLTLELDLVPDHQQAFEWGTLSANQDYPRGHFLLSFMHQYGTAPDGINDDLARKHLERAVEHGEPDAIARKGTALMLGELYDRDIEEGIKLLRKAASLGNKFAIEELKKFD